MQNNNETCRVKISYTIIEKLIGMICSGELKTNDHLPPERQLTEEFNVSRATLREALSAMEVVGIIETRPGAGRCVTDLDIVPFVQLIARLLLINASVENELLELRELLEKEAIRLIIARVSSPDELTQLYDQVDLMERSLIEEDLETSAGADFRFHQTLFALSGNRTLYTAGRCISSILESSVRYNRAKILRDPNNLETLYTQHRLIYRALVQKDEEAALRLLSKHLNQVKEVAC